MQVNHNIKILFEEKKVDELVIKHHTEDCKFISLPESQTISGRSGVAKVYKKEQENGATSLQFETVEVGAMGSMNMAYDCGNSNFFNASGKVVSQGRYIVIWKRINGSMHLYIDIAQPTDDHDTATVAALPV